MRCSLSLFQEAATDLTPSTFLQHQPKPAAIILLHCEPLDHSLFSLLIVSLPYKRYCSSACPTFGLKPLTARLQRCHQSPQSSFPFQRIVLLLLTTSLLLPSSSSPSLISSRRSFQVRCRFALSSSLRTVIQCHRSSSVIQSFSHLITSVVSISLLSYAHASRSSLSLRARPVRSTQSFRLPKSFLLKHLYLLTSSTKSRLVRSTSTTFNPFVLASVVSSAARSQSRLSAHPKHSFSSSLPDLTHTVVPLSSSLVSKIYHVRLKSPCHTFAFLQSSLVILVINATSLSSSRPLHASRTPLYLSQCLVSYSSPSFSV